MAALNTTKSGTITAAKTAQLVSAANSGRTYWLLQNTHESDVLGLGVASGLQFGAPGVIELQPGQIIDSSSVDEITQSAIYVVAAFKGVSFTYWEVA